MYINKLDDKAKGYTLDWSENIFVIKKLKILYHRHV